MFSFEDSKTGSGCLSVCPYPEKRNHPGFVNISPTLVIDTSIEKSSRVLQHGNLKICNFFQKSPKFEFCFMLTFWNHLSFVNISPTLVIGKVFTSTTTCPWKPEDVNFLKLKVAKARKNSSVRRHFPKLFIGVSLQCTSYASCLPWKQHFNLLPPNKFY